MLRERDSTASQFLSLLSQLLSGIPAPKHSPDDAVVAMTGTENPQKTKAGNRQLPVQLVKLGFQEDGANLHCFCFCFLSLSILPPIYHLTLGVNTVVKLLSAVEGDCQLNPRLLIRRSKTVFDYHSKSSSNIVKCVATLQEGWEELGIHGHKILILYVKAVYYWKVRGD